MADPIEQPIDPVPVASAPPEPVVPAAAPAVETAAPVNAAPVDAPSAPVAADPLAVAGAVPAPVPEPQTPTSEPTLLEKFDAEKKAKDEAAAAKPAEEKPAEAPKPEAEKPAEAPVAEPAAEPVPAVLAPIDYFEKLTIPETLKVDDAMKADVTAAFDAFRADPVEGAQKLIDLHNTTMQQYADFVGKEQWRTFNDTRKGWQAEVMADPKMGGSRYETAMAKVAEMRDMFISDAKPGTPQYEADAKSFEQFLRTTGAGDHPAFLRLLHNAATKFGAPTLPPPNPKPTPNNGRSPSESRRERLYGNSNSQP